MGEDKPPPPTENVSATAKNLADVRNTKASLKKHEGTADLVQFYIGTLEPLT